jgi:hypothetical protein
MLILREDQQESVRSLIRGDCLKVNASLRFAFDPEPDCRDLVALFEDVIGEIKLTVEFKRPRMYGESTGGRSRCGGLVDDTRFHSGLGQPERKD